jgi:hypothetical protein
MDWNNNPRVDIENRIKQLENRLRFLRQYISTQYSQRDTNYRACRLIDVCRDEWEQLNKI